MEADRSAVGVRLDLHEVAQAVGEPDAVPTAAGLPGAQPADEQLVDPPDVVDLDPEPRVVSPNDEGPAAAAVLDAVGGDLARRNGELVRPLRRESGGARFAD